MEVSYSQLLKWTERYVDALMRVRHHKDLEKTALDNDQRHLAIEEQRRAQTYIGRRHAFRTVLCDLLGTEALAFNEHAEALIGEENELGRTRTYAIRLLVAHGIVEEPTFPKH